jgi:peptidoglycan/LPS O-acetylase OafA/YrhL
MPIVNQSLRNNCFDFIRLLAALQVMLLHVAHHIKLQPEFPIIHKVLSVFPGVPIFFTISGFLITASIFNNPNIKYYFRNRYLRIFPALYLVFIITFIILLVGGVFSSHLVVIKDILIWTFFSIFTIYPNITPQSIKNQLTTNDPNGSLWTIPVEIQFYLIVPLLYIILKKSSLLRKNILIICLFILSVVFNVYRKSSSVEDLNPVLWKFLTSSVFPHFWNFCLGMIIYLNWEKIKKIFENRFIWWSIVYIVIIIIFKNHINNSNLRYYIYLYLSQAVLSGLIISFAYTFSDLNNILRGNDMSYGIYIYHMPIANLYILNFGVNGNPIGYLLILCVVILISFLSWKFVEKPSLQLKKYKSNSNLK